MVRQMASELFQNIQVCSVHVNTVRHYRIQSEIQQYIITSAMKFDTELV